MHKLKYWFMVHKFFNPSLDQSLVHYFILDFSHCIIAPQLFPLWTSSSTIAHHCWRWFPVAAFHFFYRRFIMSHHLLILDGIDVAFAPPPSFFSFSVVLLATTTNTTQQKKLKTKGKGYKSWISKKIKIGTTISSSSESHNASPSIEYHHRNNHNLPTWGCAHRMR